jgi:hypothetical protein
VGTLKAVQFFGKLASITMSNRWSWRLQDWQRPSLRAFSFREGILKRALVKVKTNPSGLNFRGFELRKGAWKHNKGGDRGGRSDRACNARPSRGNGQCCPDLPRDGSEGGGFPVSQIKVREKRDKRDKSPSYVPAGRFFAGRGRSASVSSGLGWLQAGSRWCGVFQVVKTAQSRGRTGRTLFTR